MKLNIRNKILITFLGALLIGILVLTIVNSIQILNFTNTSSDITYNAMNEEELSNLDRIAQDKALLFREYLRAMVTDITSSYDFASELFTGQIVIDPVESYWADSAVDSRTLPSSPADEVSDYHDGFGFASWAYSTIYIPGIDNSAEYNSINQELKDLIALSSGMEYIFKSMHASNPDYIWIYMGFENSGLFRQLPYNDLSWAREDNTDFTESLWYTSAVAKDGLSIILDDDPDSGLVITASFPVKDSNNNLVGVVGVDLPIDTVADAIIRDSVLENGYPYMTDKQGNALIHPKLVDDASLFGLNIRDIEFSDSSEGSSYQTVVNTLVSKENGQSSFIKNGEKWYISYADVGYEFSMFVVVPENDILAPAEAIRETILSIFKSNLISFLMIIIAISAVISYITGKASKKIVAPINELTQVTQEITKGNLRRDLQGNDAGSQELNMLYNTFSGLITALRFGNQDYYAGDINRAMKNYKSALELFTTLKNEKGIGISLNNIANIYKARGELKDANKYYRDSIVIAENLLENADDKDKIDLIVSLASRYNNIGLLYKDIEKFDRAEEYMNKALELDRQVDNARGFATRYGNLGLIYLAQNRVKDAKNAFDDAYSIAEAKNNPRAIAYSTMNYGVYNRAIGNLDEAVEYFLKAVELAEDIDIRVVSSSLRNVQEIFEEQGKTEMAEKIKNDLKSKAGSGRMKEVAFVLDYSGSMTGKRIKNATRGINNIFKQQINENDIVSLVIFNSNYEEIIKPTPKVKNTRDFILTVDSLIRPYGATAFYDALGYAFQDIVSSSDGQIESWIIALTDGDDNSSRYFNPDRIIDLARNSIGVNLVIIGVGRLRYRDKFIEMCSSTDKGTYIDVSDGVADAITTAFEEVSSMLSEIEVEGFVPDEN